MLSTNGGCPSTDACKAAIDLDFHANPQQAGRKICGKDLVKAHSAKPTTPATATPSAARA